VAFVWPRLFNNARQFLAGKSQFLQSRWMLPMRDFSHGKSIGGTGKKESNLQADTAAQQVLDRAVSWLQMFSPAR